MDAMSLEAPAADSAALRALVGDLD